MIYFIHNARERIEHKVTNKKDGSFSFHLFTFKSIILFPQQVCSNFLTQVFKCCDTVLVHDFREAIDDFRAGIGICEVGCSDTDG